MITAYCLSSASPVLTSPSVASWVVAVGKIDSVTVGEISVVAVGEMVAVSVGEIAVVAVGEMVAMSVGEIAVGVGVAVGLLQLPKSTRSRTAIIVK